MHTKNCYRLVSLLVTVLALTCGSLRADATHLIDHPAWLPEVEELYQADIYDSRSSALRGILAQMGRDGVSAKALKLEGAAAIKNAFLQVLPADRRTEEPEPSESQTATISEFADNQHTTTVTVDLAGEQFWSARYESKPWLWGNNIDEDRFAIVHGLANDDVYGSQGDVLQLAKERVLLPEIERRVGAKNFRKLRRRIHNYVDWAFEDSQLITDRFRQTFTTEMNGEPQVALVREAVLVDLAGDELDAIVHRVSRDARRVRARTTTAFGFAGVVLIVTFIVCRLGYVLLNKLTRGYYEWPLRIVTTAIVGGAILLSAVAAVSFVNTL